MYDRSDGRIGSVMRSVSRKAEPIFERRTDEGH